MNCFFDYVAHYIEDFRADYIAHYIADFRADYIADYICELSYATCTRINAVGTKVQFAFAVPVSALVKAPIEFPLSVQIVRPESGKTFRHKRKSFVIPNTSLYRGS